jgi:ABC-type bacteriocin/lantibiotic exporter with double-glycine peptidase domain
VQNLEKKMKDEISGGATFRGALGILPKNDKQKLIAITAIQVSLGVMDLFGVLAVGLLGTLSITGIQSKEPGGRVSSVLSFLSLSNSSFQKQVVVIGLAAVFLLVGRTILSIVFTRRILYFMSRRGAVISANLISRFLSQPLLTVQRWSIQESLFAVTTGVEILTLNVLALSVVMIADVALLVILVCGLFIVDPLTSIGTVTIFGFVALILYKLMHERAGKIGAKSAELNIRSSEKIVEVFSSYRESIVRNRRDFYSREIAKSRFDIAEIRAEISFMPYISKYVIETTVIVGAVLIGAAQFMMQDAVRAAATLGIFIAAGSRIAPAVLRIQQSSVMIKGSLGVSKPTLDLIEFLGHKELEENLDDQVHTWHEGFDPNLEVSNVSLRYPEKAGNALVDVTMNVQTGQVVAIVGPSGAGKTTLVDVLLGVLEPDKGSVKISGLTPLEAIAKWPGAVAYVPQDVLVVNGSIRENVALGYPLANATDELVNNALRIAALTDFVASAPGGLEMKLGERGAKISGGQRQRIGIARALFTKPKLLVLDEATSSLDGGTEESISADIQKLKGSTTVVLIAHRLSTVRDADLVFYMDKGEIVAQGTFEEVRSAVPDFDRQAKLMGL